MTRQSGCATPIGEEIREGERHRTLLSLAGSMRHRGMTAEEMTAVLLAVNAGRCRPPLDEPTVAELARDVACRYEPAPPDPEQERIEREAERLLCGADERAEQVSGRGKLLAGRGRKRRLKCGHSRRPPVEFLVPGLVPSGRCELGTDSALRRHPAVTPSLSGWATWSRCCSHAGE